MYSKTANKGRLGGTEGDDVLTGIAHGGKGQIHVYARGGEDTLNLNFADDFIGFSHGHHARGDNSQGADGKASPRSEDIFNFTDTQNVGSGTVVVGRLEDLDANDRIQIEGEDIDLNDLPSNVRIVEFNGAHTDDSAASQQWLLITTSTGGNIFYALEGARVDLTSQGGANGGTQEKHFLSEGDLPDFTSLMDVEFVEKNNHIPSEFTAKGGISINDVDHDASDVMKVIFGSSKGDLIAAGLNDDVVRAGKGSDYIWGGSGHDTIYAGSGDDTINGGHDESIGIACGLRDASAQVFRLFDGVFNRDPNAAGFEAWIDILESGRLSFQQVVSSFTNTAEFKYRFGGSTNDEFVTSLFENVLDRAPAESGLASWGGALGSGLVSRAEAVTRFTECAEFRIHSDDDFYTFVGSLRDVDDVMHGGSGADVFVFEDNFGRDVIADFDTTQKGERIDLSSVDSIVNFQDLQVNHLTQVGEDAVISDAIGNSIILQGVDMEDLSHRDFIF